jgi:DNA-binding NarL/FixJ family response regulator
MQRIESAQMGTARATYSTEDSISIQLYSPHELHHAALQYICRAGSGFVLECTRHELPRDLKLFQATKSDLVILGMALFAEQDPDTTHTLLKTICEQTTVMLLAERMDNQAMRSAMTSGVSGYLLTSFSLDTFRSALQTVAAGGFWFGQDQPNPHIVPSFAERVARSLSQRERQILNYVASGFTSKEVAHRLSLSQSSVRTYWYRVLSKLNALNKAEALVRAANLGLLDPATYAKDGGKS